MRLLDDLIPALFGHASKSTIWHRHARVCLKLRLVRDQEVPVQVIKGASVRPKLDLRVISTAGAIVRHSIDVCAGSRIGF